jgi:hypothetical protein
MPYPPAGLIVVKGRHCTLKTLEDKVVYKRLLGHATAHFGDGSQFEVRFRVACVWYRESERCEAWEIYYLKQEREHSHSRDKRRAWVHRSAIGRSKFVAASPNRSVPCPRAVRVLWSHITSI